MPLTPDDLARDAKAVVVTGALAIHVHPRDADGKQTLGPRQCAAAITAIRDAAPTTPVGITTIATIERDPRRRVALVRKWTQKPDFVSVSWSEDGAAALATACVERDIAIEAGIWTVDDAERFVEFGFAPHCLRALVEPAEETGAGGHGIRIGLEDTLALEGGRRPKDNAELVAAAVKLAA